MITRNVFGKIEPRIGNYFVKKNFQGKYEILKYDSNACMVTDAYIGWYKVDPFDSMVQAYAWLKKNVNDLI